MRPDRQHGTADPCVTPAPNTPLSASCRERHRAPGDTIVGAHRTDAAPRVTTRASGTNPVCADCTDAAPRVFSHAPDVSFETPGDSFDAHRVSLSVSGNNPVRATCRDVACRVSVPRRSRVLFHAPGVSFTEPGVSFDAPGVFSAVSRGHLHAPGELNPARAYLSFTRGECLRTFGNHNADRVAGIPFNPFKKLNHVPCI